MTFRTKGTAPAALQMTPRLWFELILLSMLWGGSYLFGRIASPHMPALTTACIRVLLAGCALWLIALLARRRLGVLLAIIPALLVMGLFNNAIPFTLILWGQKEIGAGLASIMNATTPIWTLLIAQWATRDEKITLMKAAGMAIGLTGVAVLIGPDAWSGQDRSLVAQLAVVGAAMSFGIAGVFGRRFRGIDPMLVAAGQLAASSSILVPIALAVDQPWMLEMPPVRAILSVVALALLCTATAYILFFRILAGAGATNASLVTLLVPVSAILLGAMFLGERLAFAELAGILLIATGLAAIDGRLPRLLFGRKGPPATRSE